MHTKCLAQCLAHHPQLLSAYYYYCNRVTAIGHRLEADWGLRGRDWQKEERGLGLGEDHLPSNLKMSNIHFPRLLCILGMVM